MQKGFVILDWELNSIFLLFVVSFHVLVKLLTYYAYICTGKVVVNINFLGQDVMLFFTS